MTNLERFTITYAEELTKAVTKSPEDYAYPVDYVPIVVRRMMLALQKGSANIGPAIKSTCKILGIKPIPYEIKAYINKEGE